MIKDGLSKLGMGEMRVRRSPTAISIGWTRSPMRAVLVGLRPRLIIGFCAEGDHEYDPGVRAGVSMTAIAIGAFFGLPKWASFLNVQTGNSYGFLLSPRKGIIFLGKRTTCLWSFGEQRDQSK